MSQLYYCRARGGFEEEFEKLARLWGLRLLLRFDLQRMETGMRNELLAAFLGVSTEENIPPAKAVQLVKAAHQVLEKDVSHRSNRLEANIRLLGKCLKLSPEEKDILTFVTVVTLFETLNDFICAMGPLSSDKLAQILGTALALDTSTVKRALSETGPLITSGLLALDTSLTKYEYKITALSGLANSLLSSHKTLKSLLSFCMTESLAPTLSIGNFAPHKALLSLLMSYLRHARERNMCGCNILLYGAPGVGKTELVRTIAKHLKFTLFEVGAPEPAYDQTVNRMNTYRFCQNLLSGKARALLLFDEVEDIFPVGGNLSSVGEGSTRSGLHKAWTNRMLEQNPVPAIWIANEVSQIDPAFLRRFDIVEEISPLSRSTRLSIFKKALKGINLPGKVLDCCADHVGLTPADATRLKKVLSAVDLSGTSDPETQIERVLTGHLRAQGILQGPRYPKPANYRMEYLNADIDVGLLIQKLLIAKRGRICLYGPPGTGKTALAYHLAERLNQKILVKRASDILSMWVGGTEREIAGMFNQARNENALLLLDEADSFLQNRRFAAHSWEITQVNELLTQMECFESFFICATNLADNLDPAVMRRFHFKIRFDYLTDAQNLNCFTNLLHEFNASDSKLEANIHRDLCSLRNLTPGDFHTAAEQLRFLQSVPTPHQLLTLLKNESKLKTDLQSNKIGFIK